MINPPVKRYLWEPPENVWGSTAATPGRGQRLMPCKEGCSPSTSPKVEMLKVKTQGCHRSLQNFVGIHMIYYVALKAINSVYCNNHTKRAKKPHRGGPQSKTKAKGMIICLRNEHTTIAWLMVALGEGLTPSPKFLTENWHGFKSSTAVI